MSISSTADSLHPPSPSSSLSSATILSIVTLHNSKSNSHRHRSSFEARDCKKSLTGKDWGLLRFPRYKLQIKNTLPPPVFRLTFSLFKDRKILGSATASERDRKTPFFPLAFPAILSVHGCPRMRSRPGR